MTEVEPLATDPTAGEPTTNIGGDDSTPGTTDQQQEEAVPEETTSVLGSEFEAAAKFLATASGDSQLLEQLETLVSESDPKGATARVTAALTKAFNASHLDALLVSSISSSPPQNALMHDPITDVATNMEGCVQVVLSLLKNIMAMDSELVIQLAQGIAQGGTSLGNVRLRSLTLLYNSVPKDNSNVRFNLLLFIIQLASKIGSMGQLSSVLANIPSFLKIWSLSKQEERLMYKTTCDAMRQAGMVHQAFIFSEKLLESYNGAEDDVIIEAQPTAVQTLIDAISIPNLYRFDSLLELDAVLLLEKSDKYKLLYEIFEIFVKDMLSSYLEFHEKHSDYMKEMGLDHEQCLSKMRLLSFASLGINAQELKSEQVAEALKIDPSEVDEWVIQAIGSGLVDAKINQLTKTIAIRRSTQRVFSREQWQPLSESINVWKENIAEILEALRSTQLEDASEYNKT